MILSKPLYLLLGVGAGFLSYSVHQLVKSENPVPLPIPAEVQKTVEYSDPGTVVRDGFTFIADPDSRRVICTDVSGKVIWRSSGEDRFIVPSRYFPLDCSAEGDLWVVNPGRKRMEQLDSKNGRFIAAWEPAPGYEFGGCCNPVVFAAMRGGKFLTMEKGDRQVRLFQPDGIGRKLLVSELSNEPETYRIRRHKDGSLELFDRGKSIGVIKDE